jgi:hypothetical protein
MSERFNPSGYLQETVEATNDEDTKRMVSEYDPNKDTNDPRT